MTFATYLIKSALAKAAKDMPHFHEQDRPEKAKKIYAAIRKEHPGVSKEEAARTAARQGVPGGAKQGPPYEAPIGKD